MNKIILLFVVTLLAPLFMVSNTALAAHSASEYSVTINLAGRQRMLTQKMSKEMLLIANNVDVAGNRKSLSATAKLFDDTLNGLINGNAQMGLPAAESKVIKKMLAKVKTKWTGFNQHVQGVISGGVVPVDIIASTNLPLLKDMNTVVRLYEKEAKKVTGKNAGTVINLAGKQRMLTQKMSKEMLLVAANHNADENKSNLRATMSLFEKTLEGLVRGDADLQLPATSNQAIIEQLNTVKGLWNKLKPVVSEASKVGASSISPEALTQLASLNLPLLKEMNKAVKMFELEAK